MTVKTWLKRVALWFGLGLCIYALWQTRAFAGDAVGHINTTAWLLVSLLLVATWSLAVMTWRQYLAAYLGHGPAWRTTMRQVGVLLVGKYVPGGVFGFLARVYDEPKAHRGQLFAAGIAEQTVGVGMPIALGTALLLAARSHNLLWLWLASLLPIVAVAGIWSLHHVARQLPWIRRFAMVAAAPSWPRLLGATALHLALQAVWMATIVVVVRELFQPDIYAALGLAGAFMLAVAAGMLVVVAPGGIGVREAVLVGLAAPWLGTAQAIFLSALLRLISTALDLAAGVVAGAMRRDDAPRKRVGDF